MECSQDEIPKYVEQYCHCPTIDSRLQYPVALAKQEGWEVERECDPAMSGQQIVKDP